MIGVHDLIRQDQSRNKKESERRWLVVLFSLSVCKTERVQTVGLFIVSYNWKRFKILFQRKLL